MDWKFIMCLLVMCSTTIWKLLEILTYGEIQVRQVDDVMTLYMVFTIYAAYKAGMAVQAKRQKQTEEKIATTTRRCTDLSRAKSFVQEWVNLDCPTLKRFSTNQKVLSVNGFGAAVPLFESPLVDTSYVDTVIADDIEDKEIEGLRKHLNPDGVISQLLNNVQKARAEKGIDEVESRVKQVETQIRLFLRTPEIENEIKDIETAHLNEEGSFDCGFIFWYPKADSQLEKDMSLLVGANRRKLSWLDIAVPTFSQSINVQRYGAELIKKLVKERLGIELYYRSELD